MLHKLLYDLIEKGCVEMIENLLKIGTDVNLKFEKGYMPLHVAAINEREEVAKLLISYEADVNAQDGNGDTPIFHATKNGDLKMIKLLLINGADVKEYPELLNSAVENRHIKITEILLQHGADVDCKDIYGRTALLITALDKNLLGDFCDVKDPYRGDVQGEIAKLLLSWGANVNAQTRSGYTALQSAVENEYVKVVEALLEYKADVNPAALYASASKGNAVITKMLLNKGVDINAKQDSGMTALHIATLEGHKEVVEVLLRGGADVNSKTDLHMTPLHCSAVYVIHSPSSSSIAQVLLKFGADIDSIDKCGRTALHIASLKGLTDIVEDLLTHGSDVNIKNKQFQTPLDCACNTLFSNRLLVSYDADDDIFFDPKSFYACEITVQILKQHIIKMKTAKLYLTKTNLQSIDYRNEITNNFQDDCEKEVAYMKSQKIDNTNVTYYNILTKDINQLALIVRNENIMQVFRSEDLTIKFPNYGSMIESNIRKGTIRKGLLEQNDKFFDILMNGTPGLPYTCVENIFHYLGNEDLRVLIETCKPTNINSSNNI